MSARVIAVGKGTNHTMAYSDNSGVTWTGLGDDVFSARAYDIAYNSTQDKFLAVGKGTGWAYYSHEGLVWKQTGENKFLDGRGIATNGDRWVAVGKGNNSKNRSMMRSDNGINWTSISNSRTDLLTTYGSAVEVYGNKWVAVGKGANHVIAYSHDNAETWTHALAVDASNTKTLITTEANTVSTNGSRWIVGGKGTSSGDYMLLVYSDDDGKTWAKVDDPVIDTFNEIFGSHYDGEKFWISGTSTGVKLAYSTDGLSWTVVTGSYYLKARGFITFDGMTIMGGDT